MTALLRSRPAVDLPERLGALERVVELGEGRLDPDALGAARAVLDRAGERMRLSAEHTVVALAGATGSGKSSLFNALAGLDLSRVGARRPTTGEPIACVWGPESAGPLLDWLGIPRRHQVARESVLDADTQGDLHGLVLLDLPDHDSIVAAHRREVDRMVALVDVLVWVMDPQKYADAAIHERYLRPLATHGEVMLVVLNQVDTLDPPRVGDCLADLRRLLADDGLADVPVLATSARTGAGLGQLRELLARRVAERRAVTDRLAADVDAVLDRLGAEMVGTLDGAARDAAHAVPDATRERLVGALADAAGVPVVGAAVERAHRHRAVMATGWPFTRWVRRLRPDPLRRLHLEEVATVSRSSLPQALPVQRARVETAVREVTDGAARGLPEPWALAVRRAGRADHDDLADALDRAIVGTELPSRTPGWWRVAGGLQWLLAAAVVAGLLWLGALFVVGWLQLPDPPTPRVQEVPVPTLLLVGGVLLGLLLAYVSRVFAGVAARRRRARAERRLRSQVAQVAEEQVLAPVQTELERYGEARAAYARASRR